MDCVYINLDRAADRRAALERNFAETRIEGWSLSRFPAVDATDAAAVPGRAGPAEKACFLSHRTLIGAHRDGPHPILVLEDDAVLGAHSCAAIDRLLAEQARDLDWDILFTDICVPSPQTMIELVRLRRRLSASNQTALLNLANVPFAGSTAYIVNGKAKARLRDLLDAPASLDLPYDLHLARLVGERSIAAFAVFPFLTSLSGLSGTSSIQHGRSQDSDLVWNTFRKMMWLDRDLAAQKPALAELDAALGDEESRMFGQLLSAMTSGKYRDKLEPPSD